MQSRTEIEPDSDVGVAEGIARGEQALAKGLSSDTPQGQSPVSPLAEIV